MLFSVRAGLTNCLRQPVIASVARTTVLARDIDTRKFSRFAAAMASEFKLKGLTSLDLKNGQKQEVEVEGIEEGKVLLVKANDEIHAVGSKCTHYGAPLVKGVLTENGRLTCPWHGACFNVKTGDVEDAPALDPIARFDVFSKDGGVYIRGEEATIKAARKTLNIKCQAKGEEHVLVLGRGSGALGVIEALRAGGFTGKITTISNEAYPPIDRTKISKALLADVSKAQWRTPEFYKEAGIDLENGYVTAVDFDNKKVTTEEGKEYKYTKLVLATGGIPRWLPIDGLKGDLKNVFVLRSLENAQSILDAAGEDGSKKIVIVGSSFIGLEVGNALAGKKHSVDIIGMEKYPIQNVMGEKLGQIFQKLIEKAGVKFHMDASVEKGLPSSKDSKTIGAVQLKDGTKLEADLVIEGVGVRPSTDYLKDNSKVSLEKDGSISVDERFQVKGLQDVFAIGDIATFPYHGPGGNGKPVRIEHWDVAQNAGRSVARTITTPSARPRRDIPVFWSALGSQLRYCGHTPNGYDDVIINGNTDVSDGKQSFVAYFCKGDEVHAVASMMKDPYMTQSAELLRAGRMPKKSELQKGVDPLEVSLPATVKI